MCVRMRIFVSLISSKHCVYVCDCVRRTIWLIFVTSPNNVCLFILKTSYRAKYSNICVSVPYYFAYKIYTVWPYGRANASHTLTSIYTVKQREKSVAAELFVVRTQRTTMLQNHRNTTKKKCQQKLCRPFAWYTYIYNNQRLPFCVCPSTMPQHTSQIDRQHHRDFVLWFFTFRSVSGVSRHTHIQRHHNHRPRPIIKYWGTYKLHSQLMEPKL